MRWWIQIVGLIENLLLSAVNIHNIKGFGTLVFIFRIIIQLYCNTYICVLLIAFISKEYLCPLDINLINQYPILKSCRIHFSKINLIRVKLKIVKRKKPTLLFNFHILFLQYKLFYRTIWTGVFTVRPSVHLDVG